MQRVELVQRVVSAGVISVIRGNNKEEVIKAVEALIAGGIKGIELTFTTPQAEEIIKILVKKYTHDSEIIIGAGTVLEAMTARLAILAGAKFIVSPTFDKTTAEICNLYQIPYLPGCMTITEMQTALKAGVDIIKLFPGSIYGPHIIKDFKAPLPQLNIMPTGGVNLNNMENWFKVGVVAVGIGGDLTAPMAIGDFKKITQGANAYAEKLKEIRGKNKWAKS